MWGIMSCGPCSKPRIQSSRSFTWAVASAMFFFPGSNFEHRFLMDVCMCGTGRRVIGHLLKLLKALLNCIECTPRTGS